MTPGVFKNRYMVRRNFFKDMKKEPFESFETIEETYELPEVFDYEVKNRITKVLLTLSPREERVIRERFFHGKTLEEVGQQFSITSESIRKYEARALRKLRHPSRARILKEVA